MPNFDFTVGDDVLGPIITPTSPTSGQIDVPRESTIEASLTDDGQVNGATITVIVDSITYVQNGVPQNGAAYVAAANGSNGFDITVTLPALLPSGSSVPVTIQADDNASNAALLNYSFTTIEAEVPSVLPVITPTLPGAGDSEVPTESDVAISYTDDLGINSTTIDVDVNGVTYVASGVAQNGASIQLVANAGNGFDLTITLPLAFTLGQDVTVLTSVEDIAGNSNTLVYAFSTAATPRLLFVSNPAEGLLTLRFSVPLRSDDALTDQANYVITAISESAAPVTVLGVSLDPTDARSVIVRFAGGGSTYSITIYSLFSQAGTPIDPKLSTVVFEILFGTPPPPNVRIFDSAFGPLIVSQQRVKRRTPDQHMVNRIIAVAGQVQTDQKIAAFNDGRLARSGRDGGARI